MDKEELLDKTASAISLMLHPFVISIPLGLVFLYLADLTIVESAKWVSIAAVLSILPLSIFLKIHPEYAVRDVKRRKKRDLIYAIALIEIILTTVIFWILSAPKLIMISATSLVILVMIGGLINRSTKVSLHVGTLSGFAAATSFLSWEAGVMGFLAVFIAAWSRIRLGKHTARQVLLAVLIPTTVITIAFSLLL